LCFTSSFLWILSIFVNFKSFLLDKCIILFEDIYVFLLVSVRGNLVVRRQPLIPRILSVSDAAAIARKPFKPPCENGYSESSEHLARRLSARKRFVPWGSAQPFAVTTNLPQAPTIAIDNSPEKEEPLPPGIEPLILWQPEGCDKENTNFTAIEVDHLLVRYLRPHQR
jgi:DNA repair and recombination RAD54-like protein